MGKSLADIHRKELELIIKQIKADEPNDLKQVSDDGCQYYGDLHLMMVFCPKCKSRNCY